MDTSDWISVGAAVVALLSAAAAFLQVRHAKTQAAAAKVQADAARHSTELQERVWLESSQPYVYADIRPDPRNGVLLLLIIENSGRTLARDVRVVFTPPLQSATPELAKISTKKALTDSIAALPPGGSITHYVDRGFSLAGSNLPKRYHVKVTGRGPNGPMDELEYDLDLGPLLDSASIREGTLHGLTEAIKGLTNKLDK